MDYKVKVTGKVQNSTALGIMNAYLELNPDSTLADLRRAFPNDIAPDNGVAEIFLPVCEVSKFNDDSISLYFMKEDRPALKLSNGSKVAVSQIWAGKSLANLFEVAKKYGIKAEVSKTKKMGKYGYVIEYLEERKPAAAPFPTPAPEKKKSLLLPLLGVGAILLAIILWLALKPSNPEVIEKVVEKKVVLRDTVYVQQIEEIQEDFNAAQFEKGKADLNDDAKLVLHDLAKIMKQNENIKLEIEGHTSAEGDADYNKTLSQKRAQAVVDYLVEREGIDQERLWARGMGSSKLLDAENPTSEVNRRTEFKIAK